MGGEALGKRIGLSGGRAKAMQKKLTGAMKVDQLEEALKDVVRRRGWLKGLDGRRIPVRTLRSALNTLIQGNASILIKKWTVLAMQALRASGIDAHLVLHVHDEMQIEVPPADADMAQAIVKDQMLKAGEALGMRVPTTADSSTGSSWAETH
jgi:DNA polymerase-1